MLYKYLEDASICIKYPITYELSIPEQNINISYQSVYSPWNKTYHEPDL
jgi:hypothetical protein